MRAKAWLAILVIGLLGVAMLGSLTKVAIESNSDLKELVRFKIDLLGAFRDSGVEEVSLRRGNVLGSYEVCLTLSRRAASAEAAGPPPAEPNPAAPSPAVASGTAGPLTALDQRILGFFATRFPDKSARRIQLRYLRAGAFGCSAPRVEREVDVILPQYRAWLSEKEKLERLAGDLEEAGCRLIGARREGVVQVAEVAAKGSGGPSARDLARAAEPILRRHFRLGGYRQLLVRVRAETPSGPVEEVRFDAAGRELGP